jgi:hypothetical protein
MGGGEDEKRCGPGVTGDEGSGVYGAGEYGEGEYGTGVNKSKMGETGEGGS